MKNYSVVYAAQPNFPILKENIPIVMGVGNIMNLINIDFFSPRDGRNAND